ncbi:hypothetical protein GCM10009795_096420 [Nocardioides hankookensis]|uniref:Uncharacterized protein n=1 Tax=Nocardioides hankookensis TaxID=443157 RepID=A0ABW1LLK6_9ACTN
MNDHTPDADHTGSDSVSPVRVPGHFDPDLPADFTSYYPAGKTTHRIEDPALLVDGDTGWGPHAGWVHPWFAEKNPADIATMLTAFEAGESELTQSMQYFCAGDSMFGLWLLHLDALSRRASGLSLESVLPWDFASVYEAGMHIGRAGENALADSRYGLLAVTIFSARKAAGQFEVGDQERHDRLIDQMHLLRGSGPYGDPAYEPTEDEWPRVHAMLAEVEGIDDLEPEEYDERIREILVVLRTTSTSDSPANPSPNSPSAAPPAGPVLPPLPKLHGRTPDPSGADLEGGEGR